MKKVYDWNIHLSLSLSLYIYIYIYKTVQSAGAVDYTDCISDEG